MATCNCGCFEPIRTASERRRRAIRSLSTEVPQPHSSIERDGGDAWFSSYACCATGNAVCTCGGGSTSTCRCTN
jgi:hypothetical protein